MALFCFAALLLLLLCFWSMPALLAQILKTAENWSALHGGWTECQSTILSEIPCLSPTLSEPTTTFNTPGLTNRDGGCLGSVGHNDDPVIVINWSFHFMKTHQLYHWRYVNAILSMEFRCTLIHHVYSPWEFLTTNHLYVALILYDLHPKFQYVIHDDHAKCRTCWLHQLHPDEVQGLGTHPTDRIWYVSDALFFLALFPFLDFFLEIATG